MKKILLALVLIFVSSTSYGAVSDDIYVRKDVFEVYMQSINTKLDSIIEELRSQKQELQSQRQELQSQNRAINELNKSIAVMSERIDRNFETLSNRIDGLDARIGDLRNDIYLGLVILGFIVALPSIQKFLQAREERKSAITLKQIEELINAKLSEKSH